MEGLNSNIRPAQRSLEERPEVVNALSVNLPTHVLTRMVDNFVDKFGFARSPLVRRGIVGVKFAAGRDAVQDRVLQSFAAHVRHDLSPHPASLSVEYSSNRSLAYANIATPLLATNLLQFELTAPVHPVGIRPDKGFVTLHDATGTTEMETIVALHGDRKSTRLNSSHLGISYA